MSLDGLFKQRRDGHHDDHGYYGGHRGFETIQKRGIKGLFESAIPLLENLWSGKGK